MLRHALRVLAVALPVWGLTLPAAAQSPTGKPRPPLSAAARKRAERLYRVNCSWCHGDNLTGVRAANLVDDFWIYGDDETSMMQTIRESRPELEMPAFKWSLTNKQIRSIIAYVRQRAIEARLAQPKPATH